MKAELIYLQNSITIENFQYYPSDIYYNTTFELQVVSGTFSGTACCEYCFNDFKKFVSQMEKLYNFKRNAVELNDICYGSKVVFSLDRTGHLEISGIIYGFAMEHSMTFVFDAGDQSLLPPFIAALNKMISDSEH